MNGKLYLPQAVDKFLQEQITNGILKKEEDVGTSQTNYELATHLKPNSYYYLDVYQSADGHIRFTGQNSRLFLDWRNNQPRITFDGLLRPDNLTLHTGMKQSKYADLRCTYNTESGEAMFIDFYPSNAEVEIPVRHYLGQDRTTIIPETICEWHILGKRSRANIQTVCYPNSTHKYFRVDITRDKVRQGKNSIESAALAGGIPRNIQDPETVQKFLRRSVADLVKMPGLFEPSS